MNDELKPCPFCGGEAELLIVPNREAEWVVKCLNKCCNQFPRASKEEAINAWNRRAE